MAGEVQVEVRRRMITLATITAVVATAAAMPLLASVAVVKL